MTDRQNPINFEEAERVYNNDITYRNFVETMYVYIDNLHLTPSEVRQACMFACYLHEARKPRDIFFTSEEARKFFLDKKNEELKKKG